MSSQPDSDGTTPSVERRGGSVAITVDGKTLDVPVETVETLRDGLADALVDRESFFHTAGEHRPDGSYVVERTGADSTGNSKVFESFETLVRLAERLPDEVVADDFSRVGLTGGRRHMVLWHLVEHPAFPFELASRQPLTATRRTDV